MKITDDAGKELPWDGKTFGRLKVSGPRGLQGLFPRRHQHPSTRTRISTPETSAHRPARLHADPPTAQGRDQVRPANGFPRVDLEKSRRVGASRGGGSRGHRAVYHPKWDERPLLIVQLKQGQCDDPARTS